MYTRSQQAASPMLQSPLQADILLHENNQYRNGAIKWLMMNRIFYCHVDV